MRWPGRRRFYPPYGITDEERSILDDRTGVAVLRVRIVGAQLTPVARRGISYDPFVECALNGEKVQKTTVQKNTLNPQWQRCFQWILFDIVTSEFSCDVKLGNDERHSFGSASVDIGTLQACTTKELRLPLGEGRGHISLEIEWVPFATQRDCTHGPDTGLWNNAFLYVRGK